MTFSRKLKKNMYPVKSVILIFVAFAFYANAEEKRMSCYQCFNDVLETEVNSCLGFQPNSTYEMSCRQGYSAQDKCIAKYTKHEGSEWVVKERGCGSYMNTINVITLKMLTSRENNHPLLGQDSELVKTFETATKGDANCAGPGMNLLKVSPKEQWCVCDTDRCNL